MSAPLEKIVIVGGGTAGWMTACALAVGAPKPIEIALVESDEIGTIGVGEATVPNIRAFNRWLGIDEADFIRSTEATFKLGIEFPGWGDGARGYFHPFGAYGGLYRGATGFNLWRRLGTTGEAYALDDYNLATRMAAAGRFSPPRPGGAQSLDDPLASFDYAYHFDSGLYARYLRRFAEARGVRRVEGKVVRVDRRGGDGFIEAVTLADGRSERGDFFLDCSGFRALLIGGALENGFDDWSPLLPVDRAWTVPSERTADFAPFTRSTARPAGWQWRIPLQHRAGNGHVFASDFMAEQDALDMLLATLDGAPLKEPMLVRFRTGVRRQLWDRNCVAIGLSGGFLEPLESTAINFIQTGITRFLGYLPRKGYEPALEREYNRLMTMQYEEVRDFILLHYILTKRPGEPFWERFRHVVLPDTLQRRIALFRNNGYTISTPDDAYQPLSWIAILHGSGVVPERPNPLAERVPEDEVARVMAARRAAVAEVVPRLPTHEQFITANGFAAPRK